MRKVIPFILMLFPSLFSGYAQAAYSSSSTSEVKMPKITAYWRMDSIKEDTDDVTDTNDNKKEFKFTLPYIRLDFKGNYDPTLSYQVRFRLNKTMGPSTPNKDDTGQALDYALISKVISDSLRLQFGKQVLFHGGWEAVISSKEEYSFSHTSASIYGVGVSAFYKILGQNFILQVLNASVTNTGATNSNQSMPLFGGSWTTSLMNGMFNPMVNYAIDPVENQVSPASEKTENTYAAVGHRLVVGNLTFDADYLSYKTGSTVNGTPDSTDSGYATRLAYQWGNWRPQLKCAKIKNETSGVKASDELDAHAALEYYPNGDANFRYHAAYVMENSKPVTGAEVSDTKFLVGLAGAF